MYLNRWSKWYIVVALVVFNLFNIYLELLKPITITNNKKKIILLISLVLLLSPIPVLTSANVSVGLVL
jgi:hypothetical protein